jgi:hypothetical protein
VVLLGDGLEVGALEDGEAGLEAGQRLAVQLTQEHVAHEHVVPGVLGDHAHVQAVLGVGPRVAVLHEDVPSLQVGLQTDLQLLEVLGIDRAVVLAPPDLGLARRLADDELVVGGAAGVYAGPDDQRAEMSEPGLPTADRLLGESGCGQVVEDRTEVSQTQIGQIEHGAASSHRALSTEYSQAGALGSSQGSNGDRIL